MSTYPSSYPGATSSSPRAATRGSRPGCGPSARCRRLPMRRLDPTHGSGRGSRRRPRRERPPARARRSRSRRSPATGSGPGRGPGQRHHELVQLRPGVLVQLGVGLDVEWRPVAGGKQPRRRFAGEPASAAASPAVTPLPPRTRPTSRRRTRRPRPQRRSRASPRLRAPGTSRRACPGRVELAARRRVRKRSDPPDERQRDHRRRARRTHPGEHRRGDGERDGQPGRQPDGNPDEGRSRGRRAGELDTDRHELAERDRGRSRRPGRCHERNTVSSPAPSTAEIGRVERQKQAGAEASAASTGSVAQNVSQSQTGEGPQEASASQTSASTQAATASAQASQTRVGNLNDVVIPVLGVSNPALAQSNYLAVDAAAANTSSVRQTTNQASSNSDTMVLLSLEAVQEADVRQSGDAGAGQAQADRRNVSYWAGIVVLPSTPAEPQAAAAAPLGISASGLSQPPARDHAPARRAGTPARAGQGPPGHPAGPPDAGDAVAAAATPHRSRDTRADLRRRGIPGADSAGARRAARHGEAGEGRTVEWPFPGLHVLRLLLCSRRDCQRPRHRLGRVAATLSRFLVFAPSGAGRVRAEAPALGLPGGYRCPRAPWLGRRELTQPAGWLGCPACKAIQRSKGHASVLENTVAARSTRRVCSQHRHSDGAGRSSSRAACDRDDPRVRIAGRGG